MTSTVSPPPENVGRGTLFALAALPLGIIVWLLLWNFGFIASIVGFGVAIAAVWLYRLGSGGRVSRVGALRILVIVVVTLVAALISGFAADVYAIYGPQRDVTITQALVDGDFWAIVVPYMGANGLSIALALGFGVLGCFGVLREAFRGAEAAEQAGPTAWGAPSGESGPTEPDPTQPRP